MIALQQAQSTAKATGDTVDSEVETNINVFENRVELYVLDKSDIEGKTQKETRRCPAQSRSCKSPNSAKTKLMCMLG